MSGKSGAPFSQNLLEDCFQICKVSDEVKHVFVSQPKISNGIIFSSGYRFLLKLLKTFKRVQFFLLTHNTIYKCMM